MTEELMKKMKELIKEYYNENGQLSEKGKELMRSEYMKAVEFEIELTDLCNRYVKELNPELFGFVWKKMEESIKFAHAMNMMPPPSGKNHNMFG